MTQLSFDPIRLRAPDLALFRKLNVMFGEAFEDADTYTTDPPDDAYLANLLAKEHIFVLVAVVGDEVVGGLVAYELDKFERARRELYIYDLAVRTDYHRHGVATALIKYLRGIGRQRGAYVIYVQAENGDEPAIALYKTLGVGEDVKHFDIAVDP